MAYPISDVPRRIVYSGSAGVGPYAFTFEVLTSTDIAVYKNSTLLTLTTDYTVSINSGTGTGTVTLVVAATGADTVTIVGDRAIQRTSDFVTGGDLFANTLNEELDAQTIYTQQVDEKADRAIRAPVTDPTTINMVLPSKADRANSFLTFDSNGNPSATAVGAPGTPSAITRQVFSGNGSATVFTLASAPGAVGNSLQVYIGGIYQQRSTYTISGSTLTFSAAPVAGTDNIEVLNFSVTAVGETDSSLVNYIPAGAGALTRSVQSKLRDVVSVKDFGAVGDGTTDDTTAIQAALNTGKAVYVPTGVYKISSKLTLSTGQMVFGDGAYASKFDKAFSGDLIQASEGSVLDSLWLAGNGASRTGRGVLYGALTPRATIQNCRIVDFDGACVEFTAPNAGSLFNMNTCEIYRTVLANPAIILPTDTQSAPRTFVSCYTTGGNLIDCGGGDNVLIEACHINTMNFNQGKKVLVVGTRIATVGATLTFSGLDNLLNDCAIAGPVEISGTASSMNMTGCVVAGGITLLSGAANCTVQNNQCTGAVVDNSGQSSNMVDIKLTSYTPTWTTSGTAPSLGNGSLIGRYSRTGNLVTVTIEFLAGSTTTFGTGDFRFSLPFTSAPTVQQVGTARLLDSGTAYWVGTAVVSASASFLRIFTTTSAAVNSGGPFVWASGDNFVLNITYSI